MQKAFWYIVVVAVILVLCPALALAQLGTIKGKITDAQTGEAMVGANVFLERTSYGAATDSKGEFSIQNVLPASYNIVVSYIGYEQYRLAITVIADRALTVDIKITPSAVTLGGIVVTAIGTRVERERLGVSV